MSYEPGLRVPACVLGCVGPDLPISQGLSDMPSLQEVKHKTSICVHHVLTHECTALLRDRSLDVILLCSLHAVAIVCRLHRKPSFADLLRAYASLPCSSTETIHDVLLSHGARGDVIAFYNHDFVPAMKATICALGKDGVAHVRCKTAGEGGGGEEASYVSGFNN